MRWLRCFLLLPLLLTDGFFHAPYKTRTRRARIVVRDDAQQGTDFSSLTVVKLKELCREKFAVLPCLRSQRSEPRMVTNTCSSLKNDE